MPNVLDVLIERGFVAQITHEEELRKLLDSESVTFYQGFDPTSDSFTTGHLLTLMAHSHLQKAGHRFISLMGTGTGMVGDPTDRDELRRIMTREDVVHNINCFKKQIERFVDYKNGLTVMEENSWLLDLNYVSFLREIGVHFNINKMLTAECYKSRLDAGLTFLEFNYMLMQAYDYLELYKKYNCKLQVGGNDQWSNILAGADLIRKVFGKQVYCMTFKLLTSDDGGKMGKSMGNAVWLDANKTSPYEFYQHFRNTKDDAVCERLKLFTYLSMEEIGRYEKLTGRELNKAKEVLAFEVTKIVHGEEEASKAKSASLAMFSDGGDMESMPTTEILYEEAEVGINIVILLEKCGLSPSRAESRRLIAGGGVKLYGEKVNSYDDLVNLSNFKDGYVIIQKGKKTFHKVCLVSNK